MKQMKFKIDNPAQSEALQKTLFANGFNWYDGARVNHTNKQVLYTEDDGSLSYSDLDFFDDVYVSDHEAVDTAQYILDHTKPVSTFDGPIKSDGLQTKYYQLNVRTKNGSFPCEVGDIIEAMVGNDFDLGNVLKAVRRIYEASEGRGKEGIDMAYDKNKIDYFTDMFIQKYERAKS